MNYFRYKQFNKDVITVAVGYYLRYALSYRNISEILRERGVNVHYSTVYRWVQEYAPILYQIWKKKHKKAYYKWRIDETYIKLPRWSHYGKLESWMLEHTGKSIMSGRADIWGRLINLIDLRPLFGFGPNTVATDVMGRDASSHNLYINMTLQIGYLGLLIFIIILFIIFMKYVFRGNNKLVRLSAAAFIAILAHQLFEITLVQNQLSIGLFQWMVIATGAGMTFKQYDIKKESREVSYEDKITSI